MITTTTIDDRPTIRALRAEIWELSQQDKRRITMARKHVGNAEDLYTYSRIRDWLVANPVRVRSGKAKLHINPAHRERYAKAYAAYQAANFPNWVRDGHTIEPKWPDVATSNGITTFIINLLTWDGHFANRTSNEGRVIIDKNGKSIRIPSSSKKGMQDIDANLKHPAHPFGIPWKIEVKKKGDVHRDEQKEYRDKVQATGGHYSLVKNIEDFLLQYDTLLLS